MIQITKKKVNFTNKELVIVIESLRDIETVDVFYLQQKFNKKANWAIDILKTLCELHFINKLNNENKYKVNKF